MGDWDGGGQALTGSQLRAIVMELRTGSTRVTRALSESFGNPERWINDPHFADLQTPGSFDEGIPQWARQGMMDVRGLTATELDHMAAWPDREELRKAISDAIVDGKPVSFSWELRGQVASMDVTDTDQSRHIALRTPRSGLRFDVTGGNERIQFSPVPQPEPPPLAPED